jgi:hypothetical protein
MFMLVVAVHFATPVLFPSLVVSLQRPGCDSIPNVFVAITAEKGLNVWRSILNLKVHA